MHLNITQRGLKRGRSCAVAKKKSKKKSCFVLLMVVQNIKGWNRRERRETYEEMKEKLKRRGKERWR